MDHKHHILSHLPACAEGGDDSFYNFYLVEGPVNRYWKGKINCQRAWVGEVAWKIDLARTHQRGPRLAASNARSGLRCAGWTVDRVYRFSDRITKYQHARTHAHIHEHHTHAQRSFSRARWQVLT